MDHLTSWQLDYPPFVIVCQNSGTFSQIIFFVHVVAVVKDVVAVVVDVPVDALGDVETSVGRRMVDVVLLEPLRHPAGGRLLRDPRVRRFDPLLGLLRFPRSATKLKKNT